MSTIAVIVPVHNGARFLTAALQSVLEQSRPATEIIVVDDGSTDDSKAVAATFAEVTVVGQAAQGPSAARNLGAATATTDYLAFLDADDLMPPERLAVQIDHLDACPMSIGCVGLVRNFDDARPQTLTDPTPGHLAGALAVRRNAFIETGGFDPTIGAGEYGDWLLRSHAHGERIDVIDAVLLHRRVHDANSTRDTERLAAGYLRVAHRAIQRARADER